jgi:hypothetical protein
MEPEGMVHALEDIRRILRPAGVLIEIHPAPEVPPFVEIRGNGDVSFFEEDPSFDYEDDLRRAEQAVATVVDRGDFALDDSRRFELRTRAASVAELREYWNVADAYDPEESVEELVQLRDAMYARAQRALSEAPGAEVVYVEPARMSRLTPLS